MRASCSGSPSRPGSEGLIWAGTNDGLVQLTRDGGKTWTNVTKNIPNLPPWGSVRSIVPSRYDAPTAYLTVDFHQVNNRDPFVYKTTDYGQDLALDHERHSAQHAELRARCIQEDPVRRGLLYLGTENAIYVSFDDGENWQPLQNDLPHAPVSGIVVQEHFNDLVISTYGRGFWILDDITPLQQLTPQVLASDDAPVSAARGLPLPSDHGAVDDLRRSDRRREPEIRRVDQLLLQGAAGRARHPEHSRREGTGRADAGRSRRPRASTASIGTCDPSRPGRCACGPARCTRRTSGSGADGTRPAPGAGQNTMLMPPGVYTVKLSAGGQELTQPLTVRKDPNSGGTEEDIAAQTRMLVDLRDHLNEAADMVNLIEGIRSQIEALDRVTADPAVRKAAEEVNQQLMAIEMNLIDLRLTGGQDGVRYASKLLGKINYLANGLASGDFKPTDQQLEVQKLIQAQVKELRTQVEGLRSRIAGGFNDQLRNKNLPIIVVPPPALNATSRRNRRFAACSIADSRRNSRRWRRWPCAIRVVADQRADTFDPSRSNIAPAPLLDCTQLTNAPYDFIISHRTGHGSSGGRDRKIAVSNGVAQTSSSEARHRSGHAVSK